jgi:hypothetical protein
MLRSLVRLIGCGDASADRVNAPAAATKKSVTIN